LDTATQPSAALFLTAGDTLITVIPRLKSDPANEDFFRCFADSANEYGLG